MTPTDIQAAFDERQAAAHSLRELATEADGRALTRTTARRPNHRASPVLCCGSATTRA